MDWDLAVGRVALVEGIAHGEGPHRGGPSWPSPGGPNIVFVLTDDHGAHAIGCYGSVVNETPRIDEIAERGCRFGNCFVTNSLCAPSRASILTGTYSHINGVYSLLTPIDASQPTFISQLRDAGYRTAMIGKWHMGHGEGHDPHGFDYWDGFGLPFTSLFSYPPEWELYDLEADPQELVNVYDDQAYAEIREGLKAAMWREQARLGDAPHPLQPVPTGCEGVDIAPQPELPKDMSRGIGHR